MSVEYPNTDRGNPDDVHFKSNVLIGRCIFYEPIATPLTLTSHLIKQLLTFDIG